MLKKLFHKLVRHFCKPLKKFYIKKYKISPAEASIYFDKKYALESHLNDINYLFMGSSHCLYGINSNLFDNYKAFNLGFPSEDLYNTFKLYEMYAPKMHNLKKIIVFYSVFSSGYNVQYSLGKTLLAYHNYFFNIPPENSDINTLPYPLESYKKVLSFYEKYFKPKPKKNDYTGYYKDNFAIFNEEIAIRDLKGHFKNNKRNPIGNMYLKKMKMLSETFGHELILVISPHSPGYRKKAKELFGGGADSQQLFKSVLEITKDYNINVLNYYDNIIFKNEDFSDWEHLNCDGAAKLTKLIFEKINS